MRSRRNLIGLVTLSAAALLAYPACAAPPDACGLLTSAQVGSIVGASMDAGSALNSLTTSSCRWKQTGVDDIKAVTVILTTKSVQAYDAGKGVRQPQAISGIGDEAYLTGNSLSYSAVSAKKGQNAVVATVRGLKDFAAAEKAEEALARAAVGKL